MIRKRILFIAVVCASVIITVEGKRYLLRPIPAVEVRRILKRAGREDVIPEGRVISQGIAAFKGFALGFKKGIISVAIADGIAAMSNAAESGSNNETTDELCFTSRSATSDIVASDEARQVSLVASGVNAGSTLATSPTLSSTGGTLPTTLNTNVNTNTGLGGGSVIQEGSTTTTNEDPPPINCLVFEKRQ